MALDATHLVAPWLGGHSWPYGASTLPLFHTNASSYSDDSCSEDSADEDYEDGPDAVDIVREAGKLAAAFQAPLRLPHHPPPQLFSLFKDQPKPATEQAPAVRRTSTESISDSDATDCTAATLAPEAAAQPQLQQPQQPAQQCFSAKEEQQPLAQGADSASSEDLVAVATGRDEEIMRLREELKHSLERERSRDAEVKELQRQLQAARSEADHFGAALGLKQLLKAKHVLASDAATNTTSCPNLLSPEARAKKLARTVQTQGATQQLAAPQPAPDAAAPVAAVAAAPKPLAPANPNPLPSAAPSLAPAPRSSREDSEAPYESESYTPEAKATERLREFFEKEGCADSAVLDCLVGLSKPRANGSRKGHPVYSYRYSSATTGQQFSKKSPGELFKECQRLRLL